VDYLAPGQKAKKLPKLEKMNDREEIKRDRSRRMRQSFSKSGSIFIAVLTAASLLGAQQTNSPAADAAVSTANSSADSSVIFSEIIASASSHHVLHLGDINISYVATWSSTTLKDAAGVPQATISSTSYIREDVRDHAQRPVMFAFNGGPGASSTPLHFRILGPRRLTPADANGASTFVDNPETLLDVADLVMIDPVGTGFSRELRAGAGHAYWNPTGDSNAAQTVIRDWLREHGRSTSPVYIVGESFGGYRLAEMAKDIGDLNVAGLILVSPGTDMSGEAGGASDQRFVSTLPSMATTAYEHGKSQSGGRSAEEVFDEARAFAQSDYLVALQQGSALAAADRGRLAERMAKLIGLPASTIAAANLRIDTQDFLEQLLPGKVVGRLDTRVAAPKPDKPLVAGRPKAADDPALHLGASNVIKNVHVRDYLRNEIGVKTDLDYISLTLDVNFAWDWNSGSHKLEDNLRNLNPTPNLAKLMKDKPAARLLLLSGYYDLATPVLYQRYALTHAGVPLDRTRTVAVAAGHTVYEDDDARREVSKELHDFIFIDINATAASTPASR
jgi:carboxypeptidase C (cathepsin A)